MNYFGIMAWLDHSIRIRTASASVFFALFALVVFSIPWSRTFSLFYHLLSIFPYFLSSSFGFGFHCLSYDGVFSFSSSFSPCYENQKAIFLSILLNFSLFTFFISALSGKMSWLPTLIAAWSIIIFLPKSAPFLLLESSCNSTDIFFPPRYRWFSLSYIFNLLFNSHSCIFSILEINESIAICLVKASFSYNCINISIFAKRISQLSFQFLEVRLYY